MGQDDELTPGNRRYAIFVCMFASMGGLYFGYDQGVTGGMFTMPSFVDDFCVDDISANVNCSTDGGEARPNQFTAFLTLYNVIYNIGSILGGLLGGVVAEKYGRRASIFFAALTFNLGTWWVITTPQGWNTSALFGRVLEGVGVGSSSFSAPLYAAECAPREYRGALAGFAQFAIVTGLVLANAVNLGVNDLRYGWRITNGVITIPPVIMMIFIFFLPESPRWLLQKKGVEEAKPVLVRLRKTDDISEELERIEIAVEQEIGKGVATIKDCFEPEVRRRTYIAIGLQVLQQGTGINPIFTYGGLIFSAVNDNEFLSLFILSLVNFLSTIPALFWVDRVGRRTLLLVGAAGMCVGHVLAGSIFLFGCEGSEDDDITCSGVSGQMIVLFASCFVFFFAISWGPIGWIYPSEIFPLRVRAKAVALSTAANWTMGSLMLAIVQLFPLLTIAGVFYVFAILCTICFFFAYRFCPETKGVMLEDVAALFNVNIVPGSKHASLTASKFSSRMNSRKPSEQEKYEYTL